MNENGIWPSQIKGFYGDYDNDYESDNEEDEKSMALVFRKMFKKHLHFKTKHTILVHIVMHVSSLYDGLQDSPLYS